MHKVSSYHLSETLINDCHRILVIPVVSSRTRQLSSCLCPSFRPLRHVHRFRGLKCLQAAVRPHQLRRDHLYRPITTPCEQEVYDIVSDDLNISCILGCCCGTRCFYSDIIILPPNVKYPRAPFVRFVPARILRCLKTLKSKTWPRTEC